MQDEIFYVTLTPAEQILLIEEYGSVEDGLERLIENKLENTHKVGYVNFGDHTPHNYHMRYPTYQKLVQVAAARGVSQSSVLRDHLVKKYGMSGKKLRDHLKSLKPPNGAFNDIIIAELEEALLWLMSYDT